MEFRQLRTFRIVAETLSFTRAAEKLFMAQSSVSAQIRSLEDELDVKLFDRIGKKVLITDAGRKLFDYARRMEEMSDEIRSEVSNSRYTRGSLTIRIPETLAGIYMPVIVERFHKTNPQVKLNFINCSDLQLREELNSGRIDLAFLMTDRIYLEEVNVHELKTEKLILVAGKSHDLVSKKKVSIADLDDRTVLTAKTDWSYRRVFEQLLEQNHAFPRMLEFSSVISLRTCLKRGLGVTICPDISIQQELKNGELIKLNWDLGQIDTTVIMIWHVEKWCSPLLSQFMELSKEVIK